jgi:hypothetical protein
VYRLRPLRPIAVALIVSPIVSLIVACGVREPVPVFRENDARFGRLGGPGAPPPLRAMCESWRGVVGARDPWALTHVSYPETDDIDACFTRVTYDGRDAHPGATPRGCGFPDDAARARLEALAARLDALAEDGPASRTLFPCTLSPAERDAARRQNALALRALARGRDVDPYAAVIVPGHGLREQAKTSIADFLPGEPCRALADGDLGRLGAMPVRSARAADALRGGVAPLAIVSGGAVHSRMIEAFALMHLLQCREGIAPERILVEPCAEHTHTNLRNGARWIHEMGGRAAYLVTDDGIQSKYFQDWSGFELILGSVDQRSLRDWGYVVGSWRQASVGMESGFWFTPYRFWAEPRGELGSATCVEDPH